MLIIRRSKLYYTASGIITLVGGRPVRRLRESGIITPVGGRPVHGLRESGIITPVGGRPVHRLRDDSLSIILVINQLNAQNLLL